MAAVGSHREIGDLLPRLSCDRCKRKPTSLTATCTWPMRFGRDAVQVDLTEYLAHAEAA